MRVDVRVPLADFEDGLIEPRMPIDLGLSTISFKVPSAGPEIELTFEGALDEDSLVVLLTDLGMTVLSSRSRR